MAELAALNCTIVANKELKNFNQSALIDFLRNSNATVAIIGRERIDSSVLIGAPNVRAIAKYGVGVDNIDFSALSNAGVLFGHTAGVNRLEVAEHVLGFAIGHFRRLFNANSEMHRGTWLKDGGRDLNSLTVGIVGFGHVGTAVAEVFAPFRPTMLCCDILDKSAEARQRNVTPVSFEELVKKSDLVTLHVPLTELTKDMISKSVLTQMKKDALLINTARGEIVDFEEIALAVRNNRLGGYAADVYSIEPTDLSRFAGNPNLYFTPHIAANSLGAVLKMGRSSVECVRKFISQV